MLRRSSLSKAFAVGILPFLLLSGISCSRGEGVENGEDDSVPVELAAVVDTSISSYISAAANLEPEKTANVLAKVEGTVTEVATEEGETVTKGQVLARLDGSELRLQFDQARIRAETENVELERARSLHAKGLMSEQDFAAQKSAADLARSELESAELRYSYTTIRAPFTGKVTRRTVDLGRTVAIGTVLFTVEDISPLLCKIHLPSHLVSSVEVGQTAEVFVGGASDSSFVGKVRMISPIVDPATGTVKVTLELYANGHDIRPGAFADIMMIADTHNGVPAIPRKAVLSEGGDLYVFAAGSDTVRRIGVTTGYQQDDLIEVTSGLAAGDSVVIVGHGGIEEGTKIRIVTAPGSTLAVADTADADTLSGGEAPFETAPPDSTEGEESGDEGGAEREAK
jgi:membrane fusion protein (multidrug efflux system)